MVLFMSSGWRGGGNVFVFDRQQLEGNERVLISISHHTIAGITPQETREYLCYTVGN